MKVTVKDLVADILLEEEGGAEEKPKEEEPKPDKPDKPGIEASTGSGRFSAGVKGALAKDDPKKLMKNLHISNAMGNTDIEKIKSMFKQAFTGADVMKKVYTSLMTVTKGSKEGLKISVSEIKVRDGIKYLYHTLVGAKNAGIFDPTTLIQIENSSGSIIIYQGKKKSWD